MLFSILLCLSLSQVVAQVPGPVLAPLPADNQPVLQAFIDSVPAGSEIIIPQGDWGIASSINLNNGQRLKSLNRAKTIIRTIGGNFNGPVIGAGGDGRWPNSVGRKTVTGCEVCDITLIQSDGSNTNNKIVWYESTVNSFVRRTISRDGCYEGIIIGGVGGGAEDNEIYNTGNGGPAYGLSTAALNIYSRDSVIKRNKTRGCGQGIEAGTLNQLIEDNDIAEPGPATPSLGINIGSVGSGITNVRVQKNRVVGYPSGVMCGNGIGRLSKIEIEDNKIVNGSIDFAGGQIDNRVHLYDSEVPSISASYIKNNKIYVTWTDEKYYSAIIYNAGSDNNMGREPLVVQGNTLHLDPKANTKPPQAPYNGGPRTTPYFAVGGPVSGNVSFIDNDIYGAMDVAPIRGDVQGWSSQNPGLPNWTVTGTRTYKADGTERPAIVNR